MKFQKTRNRFPFPRSLRNQASTMICSWDRITLTTLENFVTRKLKSPSKISSLFHHYLVKVFIGLPSTDPATVALAFFQAMYEYDSNTDELTNNPRATGISSHGSTNCITHINKSESLFISNPMMTLQAQKRMIYLALM